MALMGDAGLIRDMSKFILLLTLEESESVLQYIQYKKEQSHLREQVSAQYNVYSNKKRRATNSFTIKYI